MPDSDRIAQIRQRADACETSIALWATDEGWEDVGGPGGYKPGDYAFIDFARNDVDYLLSALAVAKEKAAKCNGQHFTYVTDEPDEGLDW